jgi:hypothetical protein
MGKSAQITTRLTQIILPRTMLRGPFASPNKDSNSLLPHNPPLNHITRPEKYKMKMKRYKKEAALGFPVTPLSQQAFPVG